MATLYKLENLLILVFSLCVSDKINLVLKDDDVFQLHNLNGCQVLGRLWLGTRLIARCEGVWGVRVCGCDVWGCEYTGGEVQ